MPLYPRGFPQPEGEDSYLGDRDAGRGAEDLLGHHGWRYKKVL
jgi:hypothetical protein